MPLAVIRPTLWLSHHFLSGLDMLQWLFKQNPATCSGLRSNAQLSTCVQGVGVNVEVKMATSAALAETPKYEVDRVVAPIVRVLQECAGSRQLYLSSFDPDIMKAMAWHREAGALSGLENLTLWFLTTGGMDLHADERRMSIAAATEFARGVGIDGIVADTDAARQQGASVNRALASGLKVCRLLLLVWYACTLCVLSVLVLQLEPSCR